MVLIEVLCNDRSGRKIRVKCDSDATIAKLKEEIGRQIGSPPDRIVLRRWHSIMKDHISLSDYEVHDGTSLDLYYA